MSSDTEKAKMVLSLVQAGIDKDIIRVMETVPREIFVPDAFQAKAFDDTALPIGHHQTVSQPTVVARMTQALKVGDRMKVLEIGTGSGYQASVLAPLCRRLYTIERHLPLMKQAEERFQQLRLMNITTLCGNGSNGWPEQAPFDRIIVTAAAADIPPVLLNQLSIGGIMVVPVDSMEGGTQHLIRVTKTEDGAETEDLGVVRFVPLIDGAVADG